MTKLEIKKVNGVSKNGNEYTAIRVVSHTSTGDYYSPLLFQSQFKPADDVDLFGDNTIGNIYSKQAEDFFND